MGERADAVVIGAGVVGLAVARALALAGREVIVAERHDAFGTETSARNSEVIHAGIYYRPGGMRARLCMPGRKMLYAYCRERHVPFLQCEKLIVANGEDEVARLAPLMETAKENGVDDLQMFSAADACSLEPALKCDAAIFSPSTGIIDSHGLMLALLGDLEEASGVLALSTPFVDGKIVDGGVELNFGGADPMTLTAKTVVNCAGLSADKVARAIEGLRPETIPTLQYGKGQYFTYSGKAPFSRLIYPMPTKDSQGTHYTRDLGGQGKLGPDISYVAAPDNYDVDPARREAFASAARRFWPDLETERLVPGYAGIRPKTAGPGEEGDFIFSDKSAHGVGAYLGLYGVESPGLTSCLAIAAHAAELLG